MHIDKNSLRAAADKFADTEQRMGRWEVWPKYGIRSGEGGGRCILAVEPDLPPKIGLDKVLEETNGMVAPGSRQEKAFRQAMERTAARKEVWPYFPLADKPALFLEFARWADAEGMDSASTREELDTDKNADAALAWAEKYGTLGLTFTNRHGFREASTRGGTEDTVSAFAAEAWTAYACLRLYEAATAKELDDDLIAAHMPRRRKAIYTATPAATREWAFSAVARVAQEEVRGNAYPALYGWVGSPVQGWGFMNLLGAMWLQMFWLLTANEASRRCKNPECDKIIAIDQPDQPAQGMRRNDRSGGYRTRKDRVFCGKRCSNRYNYLSRTKPRRRSAREV